MIQNLFSGHIAPVTIECQIPKFNFSEEQLKVFILVHSEYWKLSKIEIRQLYKSMQKIMSRKPIFLIFGLLTLFCNGCDKFCLRRATNSTLNIGVNILCTNVGLGICKVLWRILYDTHQGNMNPAITGRQLCAFSFGSVSLRINKFHYFSIAC